MTMLGLKALSAQASQFTGRYADCLALLRCTAVLVCVKLHHLAQFELVHNM